MSIAPPYGFMSIGTHNLLSRLPARYSALFLKTATPVHLSAGDVLFESGAPGDGCYWLKSGALKVIVTSDHGEERIIAILGPGAMVGELSMIDGLPRSATVRALRDSQLSFVSRRTFLQGLRKHPELQEHLIETLVERLRGADQETAAASFLSAKARLARALLQFADHLGKPTGEPGQIVLHQKIRQVDLAAMAGVARESASRTLSLWQEQKVVISRSGATTVINRPRLLREVTNG
jgi:CRP/FNR family cyclic AMP-dependent transcriptional regulator